MSMQGGGGEELSIEELASNLSTYTEQLQQVRKLLDDDPGNSEYADMEKELVEVISLTEELLATAKQSEDSGVDVLTTVGAYPGFHHDQDPINMSDLSDKFPVGTKVQAVWSEDGE
ncbi:Survival of motor neuron-related-splicing factor like, partial [Actinidia chinensis var. chinensis]